MPLIHRKTPSAFKKNIETEMEHGKPQKQAVAIAYSVKRHAEHPKKMADGGCVGPECKGCSSPSCYAKGGQVGVHEAAADYGQSKSGGESVAGKRWRTGDSLEQSGAKIRHQKTLEDLKRLPKPKLYAEGGAVDSWTKREDNERGVHGSVKSGMSTAGIKVRHAQEDPDTAEDSLGSAKLHHKKVLGEMQSMPKPKLYAEGGEVSDGEPEMDDELKHAMGGELMDALDRKDRKGIMSSLEAIVLSCRGKE